jgi:hypothetical protein
MTDMALTNEIAAFLRERAALKAQRVAPWVVFAGEQFQGAFDGYEAAARFAIERFKNTAFLVRNVDAEEEQVPLVFAEGT